MPSLEKARITNTVTGEDIEVMFNPEQYALGKDMNYAQAQVPGLSSPLLQFVNGGLQTLDMELLLDTYEAHGEAGRRVNQQGDDVRNLTRRVTGLMEIDPTTHAPPVLLFTWGSLTFRCVLARVRQRFVLFRPDGIPVRARLEVSFAELRSADLEAKEVKRETADYSKRYVVGEGETISSVAGKAYGDPSLWRAIALRNQVDDPREVPAGATLLIPPLPFRDPDSGEVYEAHA
jgi:hypothetical protein